MGASHFRPKRDSVFGGQLIYGAAYMQVYTVT